MWGLSDVKAFGNKNSLISSHDDDDDDDDFRRECQVLHNPPSQCPEVSRASIHLKSLILQAKKGNSVVFFRLRHQQRLINKAALNTLSLNDLFRSYAVEAEQGRKFDSKSSLNFTTIHH